MKTKMTKKTGEARTWHYYASITLKAFALLAMVFFICIWVYIAASVYAGLGT